jgi:glycosyltransferase involved in cell wall biosynthesis
MIKQEFGKPGIIHVNVLTRLGMLALLYKCVSGTPYVITEHWTRYLPQMENFRGFFRKAVTRMVVKYASAVMPVTENLKFAMEYRGLINRNWRIIPNVVDMEMFHIRENLSGRVKKSFIHVSCFDDRQKNISGILRVLKRLSEQRTDWICGMVGEGIHLENMMAYAKELNIEPGFVIFHGLKEKNDLATMIAESDFQVLFSRYENLPVVILESFACGVPVLSTDVGGIREHLHNEMGLLIRSEDEDKLLDKLNFMLDHHRDYNKQKIREYAKNHFSKEVIGRQLSEVYSAIK